jgi:hypothetical protein
MSESGFFLCYDCRVTLALGKASKREDDSINYYLSGVDERNWQQMDLDRALWKFVADHTGHHVALLREYSREYNDWTVDEDANGPYVTIGGDARDDIPFEVYLADWSG